jgi:AcrR family transcriptional regulator
MPGGVLYNMIWLSIPLRERRKMMHMEPNSRKEQIFDIALGLFAKNGFENVSMRDIAAEAGIKAASIYNHFPGKEEILEAIYEYFGEHRTDNRQDAGHIKAAVEGGSALEVVTALYDTAFAFEGKVALRMILTAKIILMRLFNDPRANHFFLHEWFDTDMKHLADWLGYALRLGRLPEDFDIESFSVYFWRQLMMMAVCAFADPNSEVRRLDEEKNLLHWFAGLLPLGAPARPA